MLPMEPRHPHDARHLLRVKRLHQNVVTAEIQNFCPECLIRMAGDHDHRWRVVQQAKGPEQILPTAIREVTLAYDQSRTVLFEKASRLSARTYPVNMTLVRFQDPLQREAIILVWAYGQQRDTIPVLRRGSRLRDYAARHRYLRQRESAHLPSETTNLHCCRLTFPLSANRGQIEPILMKKTAQKSPSNECSPTSQPPLSSSRRQIHDSAERKRFHARSLIGL